VVPLEAFSRALLRIGTERQKLTDPSFVRLHKIYLVGPEGEQRAVFVSEYMGRNSILECSELLSCDREKKELFPVGRAILLLRRMAEGLWELHKAEGKEEWERTFGALTPDHVYYDRVADRLRVSRIGVSSFLWHVYDWNSFVRYVEPEAKDYITPEQQRDSTAGRLTPRTDQYMLGRLGVELLEGLRFKEILNEETPDKFWKHPERFIKGVWIRERKELWNILKQMIKEKPSERFPSMDEVVQGLRTLEEEGRALSSYRITAAPKNLQLRFFEQFYAKLFDASPSSKDHFKRMDKQNQKLAAAMDAVINFANNPASLEQFLDSHRGKGITRKEFENFHRTFLITPLQANEWVILDHF
jgi:hypothetical protein